MRGGLAFAERKRGFHSFLTTLSSLLKPLLNPQSLLFRPAFFSDERDESAGGQ